MGAYLTSGAIIGQHYGENDHGNCRQPPTLRYQSLGYDGPGRRGLQGPEARHLRGPGNEHRHVEASGHQETVENPTRRVGVHRSQSRRLGNCPVTYSEVSRVRRCWNRRDDGLEGRRSHRPRTLGPLGDRVLITSSFHLYHIVSDSSLVLSYKPRYCVAYSPRRPMVMPPPVRRHPFLNHHQQFFTFFN